MQIVRAEPKAIHVRAEDTGEIPADPVIVDENAATNLNVDIADEGEKWSGEAPASEAAQEPEATQQQQQQHQQQHQQQEEDRSGTITPPATRTIYDEEEEFNPIAFGSSSTSTSTSSSSSPSQPYLSAEPNAWSSQSRVNMQRLRGRLGDSLRGVLGPIMSIDTTFLLKIGAKDCEQQIQTHLHGDSDYGLSSSFYSSSLSST